MRGRASQRGFTLLEVLVAFVIASLAFAVLAHAGLEGLRSASLSARYQEALARARSHLAALGDDLQPSDRQGDEGDGYHWHVQILRLGETQVAPAPSSAGLMGANRREATLFAVRVAMSWNGSPRRSVLLQTERISTAAASR